MVASIRPLAVLKLLSCARVVLTSRISLLNRFCRNDCASSPDTRNVPNWLKSHSTVLCAVAFSSAAVSPKRCATPETRVAPCCIKKFCQSGVMVVSACREVPIICAHSVVQQPDCVNLNCANLNHDVFMLFR